MRAKVRGAERAREERAADLERRAAMFWMLHEAGASYGAIARAARLSPGRVRQVCQDYASTAGPSTLRVGSPSWSSSVAQERYWVPRSETGDGSLSRVSSRARNRSPSRTQPAQGVHLVDGVAQVEHDCTPSPLTWSTAISLPFLKPKGY
jgi:hypothetical protein